MKHKFEESINYATETFVCQNENKETDVNPHDFKEWKHCPFCSNKINSTKLWEDFYEAD